MRAFIIVGNLGGGIDQCHDGIESFGRHRHGAKAESAAHRRGIEKGAEAGDGADLAQPGEPVD